LDWKAVVAPELARQPRMARPRYGVHGSTAK
jgi:hypothetical protein